MLTQIETSQNLCKLRCSDAVNDGLFKEAQQWSKAAEALGQAARSIKNVNKLKMGASCS